MKMALDFEERIRIRLTWEAKMRVKSASDLWDEIHSIEKILMGKKNRLKDKLKELNEDEFYIYNQEISLPPEAFDGDDLDIHGRRPEDPHYNDNNYDVNGDYVGE